MGRLTLISTGHLSMDNVKQLPSPAETFARSSATIGDGLFAASCDDTVREFERTIRKLSGVSPQSLPTIERGERRGARPCAHS
jgi:hypothetical protein